MLLGMDAINLSALHSAQSNYAIASAHIQVRNMHERLHAYHQLTANDIAQWNEENKQVLAQGNGEVVGEYPRYIITLKWGGYKNRCVQSELGKAGCLYSEVIL